MNPSVIVAATITGLLTIFGAVISALISSDKLIITDLFRWKRTFKRSIVILINGGSGAGKTTLAWALARKFNIASVFGTDLLREAIRYCKEQSDPQQNTPIFRSSYETGNMFSEQCEEICGPLLRIIGRIREKRDPVIIEGVNIMASQIFDEIPLDSRNGIFFINLYIDNTEIHEQRLRDRSDTANRNWTETDKYIKNIEAVRCIDQFLRNDTCKYLEKDAFVKSYENSAELSKVVDKIEKDIRLFRRANRIK